MSGIKEDVIIVKELLATRMKGQGTAVPISIGTGSTSEGLVSSNDLYVTGKLEVDDDIEADGNIRCNNNLVIGDSIIWGGLSTATRTQIQFSGSFDQFLLAVGSDYGRQLVIGDAAYNSRDYDHATPTDPTLFIHSIEDPNTSNTEWISFTHNGTDGVIDTGSGTLNLGATGNVNFAGATFSATGDTATNGYVTLEVAGAAVKFATVA
jgi:hypothetical protein